MIAPRERLDFDRPEAWGMKFAAAVAAYGALEAPRSPERGEVELGLEVASVPSLSAEERRIGFVGTKQEEIDRVPAFARLRATVGLGRAWTLGVAVVPPVEIDGLEPNFVALAIGRPLVERGRLRLAGRLAGQVGTLVSDITCSRRNVRAGDDPAANPFGCEAPSRDELETTTFSVELIAARASGRAGGFEPYVALAAHRLAGEFQVDARYRGVVDRTHLEAEGTFWSVAAGAAGALRERWRLGGELFYAPLEIARPGAGSTNEPVSSLRVRLARRVR